MSNETPIDMDLLFPDTANATRPWEDIHEASPEALAWFDGLSEVVRVVLFGDKVVSPGMIEHTYKWDTVIKEVLAKHNANSSGT